ncbi:phage tail protein [Intestinirhabdus alba]|uniref:phage tail protein n=1 Tax=Intestinirhabdus alba TaxID=2899544 RepID=UPI0038B22E7A
MEIINAAGKNMEVAAGQKHIKISQVGTTVKVALSKKMISGAQKDKDNLILLQKDGTKFIVEDFFKTEGGVKNKLILEEGGKAWEANYNAEHFAGLSFVPVKAADERPAPEAEGEVSTAVWLVPLVAVAAAGLGVAVYNHNNSDSHSSKHSGDSKEKQALDQAQNATVAKESELAQAQDALSEAMKAMQDDPTAATIGAVEEATATLKKAQEALNDANARLKSAVDAAKVLGIDTAAAEKTYAQAAADSANADALLVQAGELANTAVILTAEGANAAEAQVAKALESTSTAVDIANKQPAADAIDDAKAKLAASGQSLQALAAQIDLLTQQIAFAQQEGINVTQASARLKALQEQYAKDSALNDALADSIAQAEQSVLDLETAYKAVEDAEAALKVAIEQKAQAEDALTAALALKAEVLKDNRTDRIEEVNKAIEEANLTLIGARQAMEAANAAVAKANADVDNINPAVDAALKPQKVTPIDVDAVQPIDKGVQLAEQATIGEAIGTFVNGIGDSAAKVWDEVINSKPLEFLHSAASGIISGIDSVLNVLGTFVSGGASAIVSVVSALGFFITEPFAWAAKEVGVIWNKITEIPGGAVNVLFEAADAIFSGIGKGISDALQGMTLLDYINPTKWVGIVADVVGGVISNVASNVWKVISDIPGKILDYFVDGFTQIGGVWDDAWALKGQVFQDTINDVFKTLYESFIKNPLEKIVAPIMDTIKGLMSNPFESLEKLGSDILDVINSGIDVIKSALALPGKWFTGFVDLIKTVLESFADGKVTNGDGSELQEMLQTLLNKQTSDGSTEVKALLKSHDASGEINLSKLVPETAESKGAPLADHQPASSVTNYHSPSAADEMYSSLPVAA